MSDEVPSSSIISSFLNKDVLDFLKMFHIICLKMKSINEGLNFYNTVDHKVSVTVLQVLLYPTQTHLDFSGASVGGVHLMVT